MKIKLDIWFSVYKDQRWFYLQYWKISNKLIHMGVYVKSREFCSISLQNIFFISEMLIIDWSITQCDVTLESRIRWSGQHLPVLCQFHLEMNGRPFYILSSCYSNIEYVLQQYEINSILNRSCLHILVQLALPSLSG